MAKQFVLTVTAKPLIDPVMTGEPGRAQLRETPAPT